MDRKSSWKARICCQLAARPTPDGIGLELAGVKLTDRGFVKVNERLEDASRPIPGRWGIAPAARTSCTSPLMTTASCGTILRAASERPPAGRCRSACSTDLEFARIGLSEILEAVERGIAYRLTKIPLTADIAGANTVPRREAS